MESQKKERTAPFPVVVNNAAFCAAHWRKNPLSVCAGDQTNDFVVAFGDLDITEHGAPRPVEQLMGGELVREIHDAFRDHLAVFHFTHDAAHNVTGNASGEVVGESFWTGHVNGIRIHHRR